MAVSRQFDHEKLKVDQLQLELIGGIAELFQEIAQCKQPRLSEVLEQLDRASLSCLLNMAEGNGRRASRQRAKFFDDARGSATECAACSDALVAKRSVPSSRVVAGKQMLIEVVSMLTKLVELFEQPTIPATPTGGTRPSSPANRTR